MKAKKKKIAKMKPQDLGVDMAPRIEVCIAFSENYLALSGLFKFKKNAIFCFEMHLFQV